MSKLPFKSGHIFPAISSVHVMYKKKLATEQMQPHVWLRLRHWSTVVRFGASMSRLLEG